MDETSGALFLQAEDGIRDLGRSRGLGDVYKRQLVKHSWPKATFKELRSNSPPPSDSARGSLYSGMNLSLIHI